MIILGELIMQLITVSYCPAETTSFTRLKLEASPVSVFIYCDSDLAKPVTSCPPLFQIQRDHVSGHSVATELL